MAKTFNLIDEPFIPCRTKSGETRLWNLCDALLQSHDIVEIADASPLTTFALYRFLLVIVQRCLDASEWQTTWDAGQLPEERIEEYLTKYRNRFDLFDAERPFLQLKLISRSALLAAKRAKAEVQKKKGDRADADPSKSKRTAESMDFEYMAPSYLFSELPTGTNINHARHTYDDQVGLCPICCAHGLLRLAPFCPDGGSGKFASLNATPPAYVLPMGETLFRTLRMNAGCLLPRTDYPSWETDKYDENQSIGIAEGFTWEPRAVWLSPSGRTDGKCWQCGNVGQLAHKMIFRKGRITTIDRVPLPRVAAWRDPHVCYVETVEGKKREIFPLVAQEPPPAAPESRAGRWVLSFWRRAIAALLQSGDQAGCQAVRAASKLSDLRVQFFVPMLRAGQDKTHLNRKYSWVIPQLDGQARSVFLGELDWLKKSLDKCHLDGDEQKKERTKKSAAVANPVLLSLAEFERRAEGHFRRLLAGIIETNAFRQCIQNDVIELTRPVPRPHRPLESLRLERESEKAVKAAFPISEVAL